VIEFGLHRSQARLDVAETVAKGKLRERHAQELIEAGEVPCPMIASVALHALLERVDRKPSHDLRENGLAGIHGIKPPG
jgi:hypothetical protein